MALPGGSIGAAGPWKRSERPQLAPDVGFMQRAAHPGRISGMGTPDSTVLEARRGDTRAFEALLSPVVVDAHRLATGLLQDPSLAEDAVQEAAVKAWRHIGTFRPDAPFRPWFLSIVANQAKDMRRARRRMPMLLGLTGVRDQQPGVEDVVSGGRALRRELLRLEQRDLLLVVLHYYLELPWAEISAITGVNEVTARSRVHRALKRLRPRLRSGEVPA